MPRVRVIERLGIILSIIGLVMMFQPLMETLFTYGFYLTALGTLIYILSTYLPIRNPRGETTIKDIVKWLLIICGLVVSITILSIYLAPYTV